MNMKMGIKQFFLLIVCLAAQKSYSLSSGDVSVRLISGYFWLDNACTVGGPQGKVVSFRVVNTKGSMLQGVTLSLGTLSFTATGAASYTSGTPSFNIRTSTSVYLGNIAAGDSATAFFYVGYNCLIYPNNTNITTDYLTLPVTVSDMSPGTVSTSFTKNIYVLRNSNNNTITVLATTTNLVGTLLTISVAYNISNVKPGNIIDMELSTASTFPAGYAILGCRFTATTIPGDFPVGMRNTHYSNSIVSNLPSGGSVTIEWTLKITAAQTGITSSNIIPFVVSDAGSAQRWQANTTAFTGTSTPTNTLGITKRVNRQNVELSDTVVYTIVISNSSTVADITIDKLVDNLPRDYRFMYLQTDTTIFPRLVTYANCTAYPAYYDTNLLYFYGQKEITSGVFSWVIPKQDSIKLVYSARVSASSGFNDTNFITAYVGSSAVGTAFAVVNVFTLLPLKVVHFTVEKEVKGLQISWKTDGDKETSHFNVYRQSASEEQFVRVSSFDNDRYATEFTVLDEEALKSEASYFLYKLERIDAEGHSSYYYTSIDISMADKGFSTAWQTGGKACITGISPGIRNMHVMLNDISGRILYQGDVVRTGNMFEVPCDLSAHSGDCIFVTVQTANQRSTIKTIVQ